MTMSKVCKHCKKGVVESIHCKSCNSAYHPSCAKQAKVIKRLENKKEIVYCCNSIDTEREQNRLIDMDEKRLRSIMKELLEEQLEPLKKGMKQEIAEIKKTVQYISDSFDEQRIQIKNLTAEVKKAREENHLLKQRIDTLEIKMNTQEEKERENNVIISGVPKQEETNTTQTVLRIVNSLNLDISPNCIIESYRLGKNENAPILMRLSEKHTKMKIIKKSRELRGLNASSCNLQGNNKIYFNEDLTLQSQTLFKKAREYKRNNNFHSVYSFNGKIYLKKHNTDEPVRVRTENDLK